MRYICFAFLLVIAGLPSSSPVSAAVVFNLAGPVSYSFSGAGSAGTLPPSADLFSVSSNVGNPTFVGFPANVRGIGTTDSSPGEIIWHFQTGSGLEFSNDVNLAVGAGVSNGGSITASYSSDNATWTNWGTASVPLTTGASGPPFAATNVAAGQDELFVRFQFAGPAGGRSVITWGGTANERPFTVTGSVVAAAAVPEPSALAVMGLGGLGLAFGRRRRRDRKVVG